MKKKQKNIIIISAIVILIVVFFVGYLLLQRTKLNTGNVTGNSAGNINNGGLFCESEGVVYFSNPYDGGCLYSMNLDESNMKKLSNAAASSINVDENYVYYFMDSSGSGTGLGFVVSTRGIYRSNKGGGGKTVCLKRGLVLNMQLSGNYLYYQLFNNQNKKGAELFKIKIDKTDDQLVKDYSLNPASCVDGTIYFNGTQDDHYLYRMDTAGDNTSVLWEGDVWNPVYDNGSFYYMDIMNDYRLCRYNPSANSVEVLTEDRVDFFNLYGDMIYYQKSSSSEPALKRMKTDGSNAEIVSAGIYSNINITSTYVYFTDYDAPAPIYKTPVNEPVQVTHFIAASTGVVK